MSETASAISAVLALMLAAYVAWRGWRAEKLKATFELWAMWGSGDYLRHRSTLAQAITEAKAADQIPSISAILNDPEAHTALGCVEHFLEEMSALLKAGMLDRELHKGLFGQNLAGWHEALNGFQRKDDRAFDEGRVADMFAILLPSARSA